MFSFGSNKSPKAPSFNDAREHKIQLSEHTLSFRAPKGHLEGTDGEYIDVPTKRSFELNDQRIIGDKSYALPYEIHEDSWEIRGPSFLGFFDYYGSIDLNIWILCTEKYGSLLDSLNFEQYAKENLILGYKDRIPDSDYYEEKFSWNHRLLHQIPWLHIKPQLGTSFFLHEKIVTPLNDQHFLSITFTPGKPGWLKDDDISLVEPEYQRLTEEIIQSIHLSHPPEVYSELFRLREHYEKLDQLPEDRTFFYGDEIKKIEESE